MNSNNDSFSIRFVVLLIGIFAVVTLAYSQVLGNFFNGDDFVHLTWLHDTLTQPELILRNFHSSWLDGTTTKFYRPLISVFMASDYLVWHTNGFGFHLTNLIFLLFGTGFIFRIVWNFSKQAFPSEPVNSLCVLSWPIASALFFGLYPLHPEGVSWITGRVDAIVTAFFLASFWSYINWREKKEPIWFISSAIWMIMALLSKEMAITIPATFFVYELLLNKNYENETVVKKFVSAIRSTFIFWIILASYFVARRWALGTFVGGYDDSLFFISNWHTFIGGWLHGLRMFVEPINRDLLGSHHILTKVWELSIGGAILIAFANVLSKPTLLRYAAFTLIWLFFALAPVYKIFVIADDLQGSRLAFLASVPLCILLTLSCAGWKSSQQKFPVLSFLQPISFITLPIIAFIVLWTNNQAWATAGAESHAIQQNLSKLYSSLKNDPQVLLIGLPDNVHGAYVCRNALWGMTKSPQLERNILNCLSVDRFEPIIPLGYLKESLWHARQQVHVYFWDANAKKFMDVQLEQQKLTIPSQDLFQIVDLNHGHDIHATKLPENVLEIRCDSQTHSHPELSIDLGPIDCFQTDFINVSMKADKQEPVQQLEINLLYKNNIVSEFDLYHRNHCLLPTDGKYHTLTFALRSLPEWMFGGVSRGLELRFPQGSHLWLKNIEISSAKTLIPTMNFTNSGYLGTKGFLHLSSKHPTELLSVDVSNIPNAKGSVLEITRPNLDFSSQNTAEQSKVVMKELHLNIAKGEIPLSLKLFPQPAQYEARAWAIDAQGNKLGVAGDHIVVSVDQ